MNTDPHPSPTKVCIDCRRRKPATDFYRVHKNSEHRQSRCKRCDNLRRVDEPRLRGDVKCPLCPRSFKRVESLRGHLSAHVGRFGRKPRGRVMAGASE